jgi:hypothetical protein
LKTIAVASSEEIDSTLQQQTGGFVLRNWAVVSGEEQRGLEHTACVLWNRDGRLKRDRKRILKIKMRKRKERKCERKKETKTYRERKISRRKARKIGVEGGTSKRNRKKSTY